MSFYHLNTLFLPIIKFRSLVRIRMCPVFSKLRAQLLLYLCQLPPVVPSVHLLSHAGKRHGLPCADSHAVIKNLCQSTTKIIAAMAKIKFCIHVNHIVFVQLRYVPCIAHCLNLAESSFTGAGLCSSRELARCFRALVHFLNIPSTGRAIFENISG